MQAEKLRQQAQRAEARASRAAREAAASEQQALLALADLKEQQALAEARRREAESSAAQAAASERRLRTLGTQEVLNAVYDAGLVVDGLFGMRTAVEVRRLQADVGLPTSGQLDDATWACVQRLLRVPVVGRAGALQRECGSGATPTPTTLELQRFLGERGFSVPMDGGLGMVTQLSLRRFQTLTGIAPTGQIDAATSACIARVRALPADRKDEALRGTCAGP